MGHPLDPYQRDLRRALRPILSDIVAELNARVEVGDDIASAAEIMPKACIHRVTGAVDIETITPPTESGGIAADLTTPRVISQHRGALYLLKPAGATWNLLDSGNIAKAVTVSVGQAICLIYDGSLWYPTV